MGQDMPQTFTLNGEKRTVDVDPEMPLLWLIRDELQLTGTKYGCGAALCGACTVHLDGRAVKSCTVLAVQADGCDITTIEGLAAEGELHPLQAAFQEQHALQCGFCTPGMIMAALELLDRAAAPDDRDIRAALEGNRCRCTGYQNIVAAVRTACERS